MIRVGTKLFWGLLLAGWTWGCSTESPATSEAVSVPSEQRAKNTSDSKPAKQTVRPQAAIERPELVAPPRPANSPDGEVHPASAVELSMPVASVSSVPLAGSAGQKAFSELVEAYRTGQPEQWTQAETAIHACGPSVLPTLLDGLQSADRATRELASMMLSQVLPNFLYLADLSQRPEVAPLADRLRPALQDESVEVRINVAVALSLVDGEGPKLVPIFQELLASDLPHVRTMSVVALGGLGSSAVAALPAIERMSQNDPDSHVRAAAVETLKLLQSQPDPGF